MLNYQDKKGKEGIRNDSRAIKVGLLGAGYWGKNLVRVLSQLGVLEVICDLDKEIIDQRRKEYPYLKFTSDFSEILKDKKIKAVVIATPAATHYKLTKKAILAGKDVFVEKPLALKVKEGEALIKLAEKNKAILMVGHLLLYHPAINSLKELIKEGRLGEIYYICSNRLNFGKFRREENVLWSFAPHDVSIILNIFGDLPKRVRAIGSTYLQKKIPDVTLSFFEFNGNKNAQILASWLHPFKEQKLTIIGSKAMAVFDDQAKDKLIIYSHRIEWKDGKNPEAIKVGGEVIGLSEKEPLTEEMKHFLECVKKRKTPLTDGREALRVLKVLDACQRSLEQSKKSIKLT